MHIRDRQSLAAAILLAAATTGACTPDEPPTPLPNMVYCMATQTGGTIGDPAAAEAIAIADAGVLELVSATAQPPDAVEKAFGRVVANPLAELDVNASISGQVVDVFVRPGVSVKQGDPIASVSSPNFVLTQKSYLALLHNEERLEILRGEGNLPNFLKDARENLKWWGMDDAAIDALTKSGTLVEQLSITAPADGVVVDLSVRPGDLIDAGDQAMQKFIVLGRAVARMVRADIPPVVEVWLDADRAAEAEVGLTRIRIGLGPTAPAFAVTRIIPAVDRTSRMARLVVEPTGLPRPLEIGDTVMAELVTPVGRGVWVPRAAVLRQGLKPVAFVRQEDGRFERRPLEITESAAGFVLTANVSEGERLVARGKTILEGAYRQRSSNVPDDDGHGHHSH